MTSRLSFEVVAFEVIAFYPVAPPPDGDVPSTGLPGPRDERAGGDSVDPSAAPADDGDH